MGSLTEASVLVIGQSVAALSNPTTDLFIHDTGHEKV